MNLKLHVFYIFIEFFTSFYGCYSYTYKEYIFSQKLDHFAYGNNDYFNQRYLMNSDYWNPVNGSIFFYTGNEGDITWFANNTGFMWEHAKTFNALLVFAEHRYYGVSLPDKKSYSNFYYQGFLTTEQALADFAYLISHLKISFPGAKQAPVIAFGGSYGGMLAAWLRIKYPHLISGALASSAPIWQFKGLTPCHKFAEIVTKDFNQTSIECAQSIRKSWKIIRNFCSTVTGCKWLSKAFNLCKPLNSSSIDQFIYWLSDSWSSLAMTDYPYPTNFMAPLPGHPVKEACSKLKNSQVSDKVLLLNIYQAVSIYQNYSGNVKCFDIFSSPAKSLGYKEWDYQSCTEIVLPMCQNGVSDMFEPQPWNFTKFSHSCYQKWKVKPEDEKMLIIYGGKNILASSNIVFSNGNLDPWSAGGVLKSISDSLVAIVIDGAAHHLDLRASNPADPQSVKKARLLILSWIHKWIQEYKNSNL